MPPGEMTGLYEREEKINVDYLKTLQAKKARKDEYKRNKMRLTQMGTDLKKPQSSETIGIPRRESSQRLIKYPSSQERSSSKLIPEPQETEELSEKEEQKI